MGADPPSTVEKSAVVGTGSFICPPIPLSTPNLWTRETEARVRDRHGSSPDPHPFRPLENVGWSRTWWEVTTQEQESLVGQVETPNVPPVDFGSGSPSVSNSGPCLRTSPRDQDPEQP